MTAQSVLMRPTVSVAPQTSDNQRRDPVTEAFRFARGLRRPETARQRLLRLPGETAAAIIAYRLHGSPERYQKFVALIQSALKGTNAAQLTHALEIQAQVADSNEEVAQLAYQQNPCYETAIALVRAIDLETARQAEIRAGLVSKHGLSL